MNFGRERSGSDGLQSNGLAYPKEGLAQPPFTAVGVCVDIATVTRGTLSVVGAVGRAERPVVLLEAAMRQVTAVGVLLACATQHLGIRHTQGDRIAT